MNVIDLQVPVPETSLPETTVLGNSQPHALKICEAIVGDEGEVSDAPGEDCLLGQSSKNQVPVPSTMPKPCL